MTFILDLVEFVNRAFWEPKKYLVFSGEILDRLAFCISFDLIVVDISIDKFEFFKLFVDLSRLRIDLGTHLA